MCILTQYSTTPYYIYVHEYICIYVKRVYIQNYEQIVVYIVHIHTSLCMPSLLCILYTIHTIYTIYIAYGIHV